MIEIDASLPAELVPLAWLIGVWEGSGVLSYGPGLEGEAPRTLEFGQRVSFSHDGQPYLNYSSSTWLLGDSPASSLESTRLAAETGYWRLARPPQPGDPGPGMLPGVLPGVFPGDGPRPYADAEAVETLRTGDNGFEIEASILHPSGVSELYVGRVLGPRIDLATDAVLRSATAREHSASTRLYGLVEARLLWAWDIAALGQPLTSHASGRLARVE